MAKVISMYDYTKCELPEVLFQIKVNQKDIDYEIVKAAEHFLTIAEVNDEIKKGDIVAISIKSDDVLLDSECERLSVGRGFHPSQLENALVGKKTGEEFTVEVDGSMAGVKVLWTRRRMVPELTDEMAADMGVEDVTTREEYVAYVTSELENEDKEKKQNAIWLMVSKELLANSEFNIDQSEIDDQYNKDIKYMESELGDDFEEFMRVKFQGETMDECKQNYKQEIEDKLKLCAIAAPMAEEEGISWPEEEYEAVIASMVSEDYSEEELKQSMSYGDYVKQQMEEYLQAKVLEAYDDRFTTTIVE